MEEAFSEQILLEKEFSKKIELMSKLKEKEGIFFDNTVIFKALITKLFIETMELDVDENKVVTAMLLCQCKKINNAQDIEKIKSYAKESAEFLEKLGFNKEFCLLCEQHNRYSNNYPRKKESDILELVDQFGGMLLDRPERAGYSPEKALIQLEESNLRGKENIYLEQFKTFVEQMQEVEV